MDDTLGNRLLERLLDKADAQSKAIEKLEFVVAKLSELTATVVERQEFACEKIEKHLEEHTAAAKDQAFVAGVSEGRKRQRSDDMGRVGRIWDFLTDDVRAVLPMALVAGYALGHIDFSAAIGLVWR